MSDAPGKDDLRGHDDSVESVAWSPDGTTIASASRDGTIKLWETVKREPVDAKTPVAGPASADPATDN